LILAIEERRQIQFTYSGQRRTAFPAIVGVSCCGNQVLYCYQTEGGDASPDNNWIQCWLNDIKGLIVLEKPFDGFPSKHPFDFHKMLGVYAQV
jgi:hypothetical protein